MRLVAPVAVLLCGLAGPCLAAEPEVRSFVVYVDGKPAGDYRLSIQENADRSVTATGSADVLVRVLVFSYRYSYRGTETWKDGRLVRLDCTANDDGKQTTVSAVADGDTVKVSVNGKGRQARADVWTTSYWQLPIGVGQTQAVTLLDCDNGIQAAGRLDRVDAVRLMIGGRAVDTVRYRVVGRTPADLWYDGSGRLVRQETIEDGHRTVLELRAMP